MFSKFSILILSALLSFASAPSFADTEEAKASDSTVIELPETSPDSMKSQVTLFYNFGLRPVGTTSSHTFFFRSPVRGAMRVFNVRTLGRDFYSVSNCTRRILLPRRTCFIRVFFRPMSTGLKSGRTLIVTNRGLSQIFLRGRGITY